MQLFCALITLCTRRATRYLKYQFQNYCIEKLHRPVEIKHGGILLNVVNLP